MMINHFFDENGQIIVTDKMIKAGLKEWSVVKDNGDEEFMIECIYFAMIYELIHPEC